MSMLRQTAERLEALPARRVTVLTLGLVVLMYLVVGWASLTRLGDSPAYDSAAFKRYAETFRQTGRLPTERRQAPSAT